jgi:hypothetical protein
MVEKRKNQIKEPYPILCHLTGFDWSNYLIDTKFYCARS